MPAEWIAAHGLKPAKHIPSGVGEPGTAFSGQGICSYTSAFLEETVSEAEYHAVIVTSLCDQMRRAIERIDGKPAFCLNLPATWKTESAKRLYLGELERLGRFLVDLGGQVPSKGHLARIAREIDERRRSLRRRQGKLSARAFAEAVNSVHFTTYSFSDGQGTARTSGMDGNDKHIPIAIVGGALPTSLYGLYDLIESEQGRVALDANENGEIALSPRLDESRLGHAPLAAVASAYFDHIPGAFRRPNSLLYDWLDRELPARNIRAILFISHTWCDLWQAEAHRMKERYGLPFLSIRFVPDAGFQERIRSQVQAFLEVLR